MGLRYKYKQAERMIVGLDPTNLKALEAICRDIRAAEEELQRKAQALMQRCIHHCGGICCRNVEIDAVISHWDFVYILASRPDLGPAIESQLEKQPPLFASDCCFLTEGVGPCLFPPNLRPEVCIATFCVDDRTVKKEVKQLQRQFIRMTRFIRWRKTHAMLKKVWGFRYPSRTDERDK